MSPPREQRGNVAEAPPEDARRSGEDFDPAEAEQREHPDSFDPGLETGYLRRGARDHELPAEIGAAPFDPGPKRYDGRRAKRAARRKEKAESKRRERAERAAEQQRERERAEREREADKERERLALARRQSEERKRSDQERARRDDSLRAQRGTREREEKEKAERAHAERERMRRAERAERDRAERDRKERKRAERQQRDLALRQEREGKAHERKERQNKAREQREHEGKKRERPRAAAVKEARRSSAADPRPTRARATRPASKPRPKRPARQAKLKRSAALRPKPRTEVAGIRPSHASLRRPTAKAMVAVAGIAAVALGMGALLGLPLPLVGGGEETPASTPVDAAPLVGIDPGTPIGLTKGPYHPVVNPTGYGEAAAKFHADRGGRKHEGQDVFGKPGTPLVAVRDAIVLDGAGARNFYSSGGGNTLVLYSPLDNRSYVYLHMLKPALVAAGDTVSAGQLVGQLGCTGSCDGPHLHFEVRNGRADFGAETKAIDPLPLLQQWPARPTG